MPNRILREGILTSPRMAKLAWSEEVFYRRLMSVVDDFGRYYADEGLLRAACYPRQLNKVSDSDVGKWLRACVDAALVRVYPAQDGERYLELLSFNQQVRAKKSKFPTPPSTCIADATQVPSINEADAHLDVSEDEDVDETPPQTPPPDGGGDESPKPKRERKQRVSLKTFVDRCVERGEKPISSYEPLLRYVEKSGLPMDFVQLGWQEFKGEFLPGGTKASQLQADWRAHFLNFVKKNYLRLWYAKPDGTFELSTPGVQASRVHREAA